ncbi:MAG: ABC transporter ATP-binding protein [Bacilli bacterium]|jgi:ABC-2 type transport system ATP-binding protein
MISIHNVSKQYGSKVKAVNQISLDLRPGEIFGFIGPNGAGKTTMIKMIVGITHYDEGSITINGIDVERDPIESKKQFGYVPDSPDMFLRLKGVEYLNFMANIYDVPQELRNARIDDMAKKFEMEDALGSTIQSYSHGMRQKIILMGALIHEPKVWILDEPMTGLDPRSSYLLKEMMKEHVRKGNTVFFSTHVLEVAEKLCDRIGIIDHGQLRFSGTMEQMREKFAGTDSLEKIFLEMTNHE